MKRIDLTQTCDEAQVTLQVGNIYDTPTTAPVATTAPATVHRTKVQQILREVNLAGRDRAWDSGS
jgi:hypothetical protein